MIGQAKIDYLTGVMAEYGYPPEEQEKVLQLVNPDWLTVEQSEDEIKRQFTGAYVLWRGLGDVLAGYLRWEREQI